MYMYAKQRDFERLGGQMNFYIFGFKDSTGRDKYEEYRRKDATMGGKIIYDGAFTNEDADISIIKIVGFKNDINEFINGLKEVLGEDFIDNDIYTKHVIAS